jgi:hypothetical protein
MTAIALTTGGTALASHHDCTDASGVEWHIEYNGGLAPSSISRMDPVSGQATASPATLIERAPDHFILTALLEGAPLFVRIDTATPEDSAIGTRQLEIDQPLRCTPQSH